MLKVAICDDDGVILNKLNKKICDMFKICEMSVQVECFTSSLEFIEKHKQSPFSVIFLDIVMPDMDGFDVAQKVREI